MADEMEPMEPELGQILFGSSARQYRLPHIGERYFGAIIKRLEVYYENKYGTFWNMWDDPGVPGIVFDPYKENLFGEEDVEDKPKNFKFGAVEICWYKYPGRSMSTNVDWNKVQWTVWFRNVLAAIEAADPVTSKYA